MNISWPTRNFSGQISTLDQNKFIENFMEDIISETAQSHNFCEAIILIWLMSQSVRLKIAGALSKMLGSS